MSPASVSSASPISDRQWSDLFNIDLPPALGQQLNQQLQTLSAAPGQVFWRSDGDRAGLFVLLAGKVRLFDRSGQKVAVLNPGESFGWDSLRAQPQLPPHQAKAALTRSGQPALVAFVPASALQALIQQFPQVLQQPPNFKGSNALAPGPTAAVTPLEAAPIPWQPPQPAPPKPPQPVKAYFPSPSQRLHHWWQRQMGQYPFYAQQSAADCGAACLVMIGRYWGKVFRINRVRDMAVIGRDGSSLKTLAATAEALGFNSRPVKASLDQLAKQRLPLVAHWRGNHYIVVYEIGRRKIVVGNPAIGQLEITPEEFQKNWTGFCLLLEPTVALSSGKKAPVDPGDRSNSAHLDLYTDQSSSFWQLFELIKPHRVVIGEIFVASIVLQIFGLVSPIFTQLILDRAVEHKAVNSLTTFTVGILMMAGFQIAMRTLRQYLIYNTALRIDMAMVVGFLRHAFSLPLPYFDNRHVGDITSRMQENRKIRSFITSDTIGLVLDLLSVFVYVVLMYVYSWKLASLVMVSIPPFLVLNLLATPFLKKISREVFNASTEENSYLIESLNGIRTIKSMAVERHVRWRWEELLNQEVKQQYRSRMFNLKLSMASSGLDSVTNVALLWLGASLVISNELSLGQFFAFNMLAGNVLSPFKRLVGMWNQFQEVSIAIERICDVIEAAPEEDLKQEVKQPIGKLQGQIKFDRVTFRYNPYTEINTLENLSFEINPGQTVAIVGRSGSGKTTLSKLLLGLYLPTTGKIWLDGRDLSSIALQSLRTQIGTVDQSTFLFSGSIRDNIALGHPQANNKAIKAAATLAGAHDFIEVMPMGYDTQIGEGGGMLSGGQRQRVAIARALLGNPRLLIFDEATSSLDTESERIIQQNLDKIRRQRTTIIIAHRLSTVRDADLILVLDQGVLVEQGSHQELMARRGQYFYLNQQQLNTIEP